MRRHLTAGILIVAAVFAAYAGSLRNGFVWDDHIYVQSNPFMQDPANIRRLIEPRYYTGRHEVLAGSRPVFLASLLVDRRLWGFSPYGYHLTNLLLHAADSLWVYALALAFIPSWPLCLLAGLLFGLHPAQTEAVNAVSFRCDLLAAFFTFSGLWVYLKARRGPLALVAASGLLFGLGLLSKEMAASLPLLVLLVELYFPEPKGRRGRLALAMTVFALVAAVYGGFWYERFRYAAPAEAADDEPARAAPGPGSKASPPPIRKGRFFPPSSPETEELRRDRAVRLWTMSRAAAEYAALLVVPDTLAADRAPVIVRRAMSKSVAVSWAVLGLLLFYAAAWRRKDPVSAFGVAWCFATLLPVSGLWPLFNPVAERYLYMVTPGFALALVSAGRAFAATAQRRGPWWTAAAVAMVLLAYGLRTRSRSRDWSSDKSLFLLGKHHDRQTARASFIRGNILRNEGRAAEAAREYQAALRLNPGFAEAWLNLGMTFGGVGDRARAVECFEKAVSLQPLNPVLQFGFAMYLAYAGDTQGAAKRYLSAVGLEPRYVEAWVNLAALYRDTGNLGGARFCYDKAVSLAPADPIAYYSYAILLEKTGENAAARRLYLRALAIDPSFKAARTALAAARRAALPSGRARR
ncbi:MAG: tetratricopeptide repeat protein [Elusimicrobia bacterium]|nr:tetratricopeptide repeat protein [Elusimicrobiota bacterium]